MTKKPEIVNREDLIQRKDGLYYKKYTKDPFTGISEEFWENGKIKSKNNYKSGHLKFSELFYPTWSSKTNYKNNECHGLDYHFDKDGRLVSKSNYKNGKMHGPSELFNDNGQLEGKSNYKNGKKHGPSVWILDGQLRLRNNYKNGILHGTSEYFLDCGDFLKGNYKNGKKHGLFECFVKDDGDAGRSDGDGDFKSVSKRTYKNGKQDGPSENINGDFNKIINSFRNLNS